MKSLIRLAIGLAALAPAVSAVADDLQVDAVVNLTGAGHKIVRPDADHPAYYFPVSKGYTPAGQILNGMAPPPLDWDVLHTIAKALAKQGYLMANKAHPPTILLVFWWGYMAPEIINNSGSVMNATATSGGFDFGGAPDSSGSTGGVGNGGFNNLTMSGGLPTNTVQNATEMDQLVMGSDFDADNVYQEHPSLRLERLQQAAREPRYYVTVSAMDFTKALKKQFVVYWTARASTPIYDHTLADVIHALVADVAPSFGRDSDGPQITDRPLAPEGHVTAGAPTLVKSQPASASPPPSSP